MADPQARAVILDGKDVGFTNSGDGKLIIKGFAPTITVEPATGTVEPGSGSLQVTGNIPLALPKRVFVPAGSLSITGFVIKQDRTALPTLESIAFTGNTPIVLAEKDISVPKGALTLDGQQAFRRTGLELLSDAVAVQITHKRDIATKSLALTTYQPQVIITAPGSRVVAPDTASLGISGISASVHWTIRITVGALDIFPPLTPTATVTSPTSPGTGGLTMTGIVPEIELPPGVIVGVGSGDVGTLVANFNAVPDAPHRFEICDRSGFKAKAGQLVETWDGLWVLPEFWEPRNDQDMIAPQRETKTEGAIRPDDTGTETFVDDLYPDGVSQDDL